MVCPLRLKFPGAFYHLTARGNTQQDIYVDDQDRQRFLAVLAREFLLLMIETPEASPCAMPSIWPCVSRGMASESWRVHHAVRNEPNPRPGLTRRFLKRCSCSSTIFK
jgi:hypothetical protein